jgi:hypothetical protein
VGVVNVANGGAHAVFLKADGTLWSMGNGSSGQLLDGTVIMRPASMQVAAGVGAIAAGGLHTVVVKNDGSLVTAGDGGWGELGGGASQPSPSPAVSSGCGGLLAFSGVHLKPRVIETSVGKDGISKSRSYRNVGPEGTSPEWSQATRVCRNVGPEAKRR